MEILFTGLRGLNHSLNLLQVNKASDHLGFSVAVAVTGFYNSDGPDRSAVGKSQDKGWKPIVQTLDQQTNLKSAVFLYGTGGAAADLICGEAVISGTLSKMLRKKGTDYLEGLKEADASTADREWLRSIYRGF